MWWFFGILAYFIIGYLIGGVVARDENIKDKKEKTYMKLFVMFAWLPGGLWMLKEIIKEIWKSLRKK